MEVPGTEVRWVDKDGVQHCVRNVELIIQQLYDEWPDGLDEIEASLAQWRRRCQWLEQKLADVRAQVIDVVDREYDYRTGK